MTRQTTMSTTPADRTPRSPAARVRALPANFFGSLDVRVAAARAAGEDVLDVSKGNPDLPTPPHIVEAMRRAVADPANHAYPSFAPRPALAEAIAHRYRTDHGVDLDPGTQIAVFHGSHEALIGTVQAFADPGSVVVVPDPGYPVYLSAASLAGAETRTLALRRELGYQPDFDTIADLSQAAALILNYPHNPTGAVATAATFDRAAGESARLGAVLLHDFAYGALGFDGPPLSALSSGVDGTIEVSTLSKTYNMAGWRIGYAAGDAQLISGLRTYQEHAFSTVFGAVQDAATTALSADQTAAQDLVHVYRRRRDRVASALAAQGWDIVTPQGGFFIWIDLDGADDEEFAERMLQQHAVALAPGSGFGAGGRGFARLSLVHPEPRLDELVERMGRARSILRP